MTDKQEEEEGEKVLSITYGFAVGNKKKKKKKKKKKEKMSSL